jgi:hypothetical protein
VSPPLQPSARTPRATRSGKARLGRGIGASHPGWIGSASGPTHLDGAPNRDTLVPLASQGATGAPLAISLDVYGEYCGPGHGDPTGCRAPVDEVDAVCCRHDMCYRRIGGHDCRCENRLLAELGVAMARELAQGNGAAVAYGEAIRTVFRLKPCVCGHVLGVPIWVPSPLSCPRV